MTWDATTPDDSTYLASAIHTQIQNDKTMIRERLEASDGTIEAHYAASSEDSGKHQPSLTGLCKAHADYTALEAFTPKKEGTLHAVLSPISFYVIDAAGTPVQVYPVNHGELEGLDDDDHTQYQRENLSRAMTGDLTVENLEIESTGGTSTDPLETTHPDSDWTTAHGAGSLGGRHFADNSVNHSELAESSVISSATGYISTATLGKVGWPFFSLNSAYGGVETGATFWYLAITHDSKIGFYIHGSPGSWVDHTIYALNWGS